MGAEPPASFQRACAAVGGRIASVQDLADEGVLFVQDGNHGADRPLQNEFVPVGVPFIRPPDLVDGQVSFTACDHINDVARRRVRKGIGRSGDILLTHRATVGRIARVGPGAPEFVSNPGVTVWRSLNERVLEQGYLYAFMRSKLFMDELWSRVGTTDIFDYVSLTEQRRLWVLVPPLHHQKSVSRIVAAFDQKLELNRATNRTLEAMSSALFRSWFVDFEPVRTKSAGIRTAGIDPHALNLFPSRLVQSPNGEVPEGWGFAAIGDAVTVVGGSTPSTTEGRYWDGGVHAWTTPKDLSGLDCHVLTESAKRVTDEGLQTISSGLLPPGSVLLSSRAPIGYVALTEIPTAINQGFIAMVCDHALPKHFVLEWVLANLETIKGRANGTTFPEVSKTNFRPLPVLLPPAPLLERFTSFAEPLYRRVAANVRENKTIFALRDSLLPKLICGEIGVAETEPKVAEAV